MRRAGSTFSICVSASTGTGTERVIEEGVGVDGVRETTCDSGAGAVRPCAGRRETGWYWYRLTARFTSFSNKRHHGDRWAPDEG